MSGMATYTPGMEISGGSLGHGLPIAVGLALGPAVPRLGVAGLQLPLRRRAQRGLDLGGRDGCGPPPARQPDRAGRHQRPAGRRPDRRRAVDRADPRQVGRLRLARPARRRQRRRRRGRRPRRRRRRRRRARDSRRSSSATPRSAAACRCWRTGRRRTSCASTSTNGRSAASSWLSAHRKDRTDDHHHPGRRREAEDLGDDRLLRRPRPEDHPGPVRARPGQGRSGRRPDRRTVRRPGQVHRHAHLRPGVPGAVLPARHGRAAAARRRGRLRRGRAHPVRVHLLGVRDPPGVRLPLPRRRRTGPQRQRRRRTARV